MHWLILTSLCHLNALHPYVNRQTNLHNCKSLSSMHSNLWSRQPFVALACQWTLNPGFKVQPAVTYYRGLNECMTWYNERSSGHLTLLHSTLCRAKFWFTFYSGISALDNPIYRYRMYPFILSPKHTHNCTAEIRTLYSTIKTAVSHARICWRLNSDHQFKNAFRNLLSFAHHKKENCGNMHSTVWWVCLLKKLTC
jgi:hypothetical protein